MVVHADETRQDGVAFEIDNLGRARDLRIGGRTNPINLSVANDDGLVFTSRRAGAVDHAYVR